MGRDDDPAFPLQRPLADETTRLPKSDDSRRSGVAALEITAASFDTLFTDLKAERDAVTAQELVVDTKKVTRDNKATQLRKGMRDLLDELSMLLPPLDPRWKRHGFNMPGAQETPDVPTNISASLIGPGVAAIKWDGAARGEYYRVWKRVQGIDTNFVPAGSPADLDFTLENLPANARQRSRLL